MTTFTVIDTETTGLGPDAQVVELGTTNVYDDPAYKAGCERVVTEHGSMLRTFFVGMTCQQFVKPTVPMEIEALATHHITPDLYADADDWPTVRDNDWPGPIAPRHWPDYLVAHNADFDKRFFVGIDVPWICTYRCAYTLIPEAPSHKNGVLRYFLNLPVVPERTQPAHRAGPDTYVTAHILAVLLSRATADELVELSKLPRDLRKLGFGIHADLPIADVPSSYLHWMRSKDTYGTDAAGERIRIPAFDIDKSYTAYRELQRRGEVN